MNRVPLEPMTLSRILDYTFKIYKDNFFRLIAIVGIIIIPVQLLLIVSQAMIYSQVEPIDQTSSSYSSSSGISYDSETGELTKNGRQIGQYDAEADDFEFSEDLPETIEDNYTADEGQSDGSPIDEYFQAESDQYGSDYSQDEFIYEGDSTVDIDPAMMIIGGIVSMLAALLMLIGQRLSQGAVTHSVSEYYMGREVTVGQAYRFVGKRFWRLIFSAVLVGLIVFGGFLLFVVPGIIFGLWFALVIPVIMVEDCKIKKALSRSKQLVKGNLGKVFLLGFLIMLLSYAIQIPFQMIASSFQFLIKDNQALMMALNQLFNGIGQLLVAPVGAIAYILLYYDMRIRKEGFDLEMLAGEMSDSTNAPDAYDSGAQANTI